MPHKAAPEVQDAGARKLQAGERLGPVAGLLTRDRGALTGPARVSQGLQSRLLSLK